MTEDPKKEQPAFRPMLVVPKRRVELSVDARESEHHSCGINRARRVLGDHKLPREDVLIATQRCYALDPGGETKLRLDFMDGDEKVKPEGTLVIQPKRGKVSATRIELDGSKDHVEVGYTAPDETIQVSIRAFLAGFRRGKVHLHLE